MIFEFLIILKCILIFHADPDFDPEPDFILLLYTYIIWYDVVGVFRLGWNFSALQTGNIIYRCMTTMRMCVRERVFYVCGMWNVECVHTQIIRVGRRQLIHVEIIIEFYIHYLIWIYNLPLPLCLLALALVVHAHARVDAIAFMHSTQRIFDFGGFHYVLNETSK